MLYSSPLLVKKKVFLVSTLCARSAFHIAVQFSLHSRNRFAIILHLFSFHFFKDFVFLSLYSPSYIYIVNINVNKYSVFLTQLKLRPCAWQAPYALPGSLPHTPVHCVPGTSPTSLGPLEQPWIETPSYGTELLHVTLPGSPFLCCWDPPSGRTLFDGP